jgi:DNA repair exonuclease SbcCD nuclease subunit
MNSLRILHTSDIHIGAPFEFLGDRGKEQRSAVRQAFQRITGMASGEGFQLLLIAGDLFEAAYSVSDSDLSFVIGCIDGMGGNVATVILPGSHDYWAPGAVFEMERGRFEKAAGVHLLTPEKRTVRFEELNLAVHGIALESNAGSDDPLSGLAPSGDMRWNIAMAHGSVAGASAAGEPGEHPIHIENAPAGFDYIALGHWHSYREIRPSGPPVIYSGAPELIARDQRGAGSVVAVTLSAEGIATERVRVGTRRVVRHSLDCTGIGANEEIVGRVLSDVEAGDNAVLELELTGVVGIDAAIDAAGLAADLEDRGFFSVRIVGGMPAREIDRDELLAIPADTVAGRFIRLMLEKIDGASGEDKVKCEQALQIGYQLFRGRNPLG